MKTICLVRIKEQVGEKRSIACTHRYADCLSKNTLTKQIKYVVNPKVEHNATIDSELNPTHLNKNAVQNMELSKVLMLLELMVLF